MPKSTHDLTYEYLVEGHKLFLTRKHTGTAYARNGNVHNPTEYFIWLATVDGDYIGRFDSRADAYEHARARALGIHYVNNEVRKRYVNVRPYTVVADEMRANYIRRFKGEVVGR